ncbi:uncharacterized protein LOC124124560 [Haliotis rufescens]|uniref:uncharacterized protein LOC124124560 n=1 Tax=Haliotis rufescens TaxID=6454 RepID=UPI00201E9843|nr:uncharacterized protein LOC124124560 [Haliotis rufescens]
MRTSAQTGAARVGSYPNAQSQPSGASPQTSPAGSSTTGMSAPRASHLPNGQAGIKLTGTPTGRNTQIHQSRIQAAGPRRTAAVQPAASNSTATPWSRSEAYNATRVATLLKALVAPSASLLPYAVVDPIPYGAARLPGQQARVELVGPRHRTVPASPNSLTQLGRAPLSAYVQKSQPKAKLPTAAPVMPAYNPRYTASIGLGGSMINGPYKSNLFSPLGSVAVPGNQLNTINPSRLTQLGSLPASQLKHTTMMKLIDGRAEVKAAKSLDCKTVASLKGRQGRTDRSMSCDDDTCPGSTSCKMVFDVAFCCPKGVTYSVIHREAQHYKMNILYDN